jgi:type II secretory pathway pseudopilin PulG
VKISKTTQWILLIGIFAILLISASVAYGRQQAEQSQLATSIAQANQDFTKYSAQKDDLEGKRREASTRISSAQSEFRQYTECIEIEEALFELAEDAGVTIIKLVFPVPGGEKLGGTTYRVFSPVVTAEGEVLPELLLFGKKISENFSTLAVESVKIEIGEGQEESQIVLNLKIYSYEK